MVMENVADATRAQLDATHAQVSASRRELTARQWNDLHVVIIGPHMPREDLVVTQYFLRLLHEPAEGRRVVYAEAMWQEPRAMELLGTHLLDGNVGEAFFGDYLAHASRSVQETRRKRICRSCCRSDFRGSGNS